MRNVLADTCRQGSPAYNEVYDGRYVPTLKACRGQYCGWEWSDEYGQWLWVHRGCKNDGIRRYTNG